MKKIFTPLLAVMMTATMSVSVFAATPIDGENATSAAGKDAGDYTIGVNGIYMSGTTASDVISADIAWEAMDFTYTEGSVGTWNPGTHSYSGGTEGGWSTDKAGITVTNHSNVGIDAAFSFAANSGVNVTGTFYTKGEGGTYTAITSADAQQLVLASAVGTEVANAPAGTLYFGISGDSISANKALGTVAVKIAKDTKIYTGEALSAALTALGTTGGIITLGADVTLPLDADAGFHGCYFGIENNKNLVLDLNGHTVTGALEVFNVNGDGSAMLTVKNGTLQYTITPAQDMGILSVVKANTQLNNVTINASGIGTIVSMYANATITDCTLKGGIQSSGGGINSGANAHGTMTFAGETFLEGGRFE